jgi:hypothetical protein
MGEEMAAKSLRRSTMKNLFGTELGISLVGLLDLF